MLQYCNYAVDEACLPHIIGNVIPHKWYQTVLTPCGKPDLVAITILSEIVYWQRTMNNYGNTSWKTSYHHFEQKFGFSKHQIRDAFCRLEKQELAYREFKSGSNCSKTLHVFLNMDRVSHISSKETDKQNILTLRNFVTPSSENSEDIYKEVKNNLKEDKDIDRSDFINHEFEDLKSKSNFKHNIPKGFEDYLPLSSELYEQISSKTEKEYQLEFVNQLIEKLALQYQQHRFHSDNAFIKYMAKALDYELIPDFRKDKTIEKYLFQIESIKKTDNVSQLKRKIAGMFSSETAYILLSSYNFQEYPTKNKYLIKQYRLNELLNLTENEQRLLLQEVKSIFGQNVDSIEIIEGIWQGSLSYKNIHESETPLLANENQSDNKELTTLWKETRGMLKKRFGDSIDNAWFSKLQVSGVDAEVKHLLIKAPTQFIADYVKSNYHHHILRYLKDKDDSFENITIISNTVRISN